MISSDHVTSRAEQTITFLLSLSVTDIKQEVSNVWSEPSYYPTTSDPHKKCRINQVLDRVDCTQSSDGDSQYNVG